MALTQNGVLQKDDNGYPVMGGTSNVDDATIVNAAFDPVTRRLLVDASSLNELTATGTVNGVNTQFTFTEEPTYIVSDGLWYKENAGWTWSAGTLTATMSIPPSFSIWGF
jgi:hypothetical protein